MQNINQQVEAKEGIDKMIDLRQGDCLEVMKTIPDKSIDLVVTDPPYGIDLTHNEKMESLKTQKL